MDTQIIDLSLPSKDNGSDYSSQLKNMKERLIELEKTTSSVEDIVRRISEINGIAATVVETAAPKQGEECLRFKASLPESFPLFLYHCLLLLPCRLQIFPFL